MTANGDMLRTGPDKLVCHICREGDHPTNLLTPCACRASVGSVHFECVKIWIETSGSDVCVVCRKSFHKGLNIRKQAGKFCVFFRHSEMGRLYSQFTFFFLVLFYLSYLGQFHCRLAYARGWISSAVLIAVFNTCS